MVKIEILLQEGKLSRISVLEQGRYLNFFEHSYKDNLEHCRFVLEKFPRWSIISGYYSMHDITKLFLARRYRLKVETNVHETTITALKELIKNQEIIKLIQAGHKEFKQLANDLAQAKKDRINVQYYTGTEFMKEEYRKRAHAFLTKTVQPYLEKMKKLAEAPKK